MLVKAIALGAVALAVITCAVRADPSFDEQQAQIEVGLRRDPCATDLLLRRAALNCAGGAVSAALTDLKDAERCNPALTTVDLVRGECLSQHGEARSARYFLSRYLQANPDSERAHLLRGRVLLVLGEAPQAAADLDFAVRHGADQPDDYLQRARAFVAAGDPSVAVTGLDAAIARLGAVPALVELANRIDIERQDYDAALQRIDRLPPNLARTEGWLLRRAAILERAGRVVDAQRAFSATLAAAQARPPLRRDQPAIRAAVEEANAGLRRIDRLKEFR